MKNSIKINTATKSRMIPNDTQNQEIMNRDVTAMEYSQKVLVIKWCGCIYMQAKS